MIQSFLFLLKGETKADDSSNKEAAEEKQEEDGDYHRSDEQVGARPGLGGSPLTGRAGRKGPDGLSPDRKGRVERTRWAVPLMACGILAPRPGIESTPSAVRAQSPNPQSTGEFPHVFYY